MTNSDRVSAVGSEAAKSLTFFVSYLVVFFLIVSVTSPKQVDVLVQMLVAGGAVVAASAILESRTHFNPFDHLATVLPFLQKQDMTQTAIDGRGFRAFGSAQHPIALSAAFVLLLPVSVYLVQRTDSRRWWIAAGLLADGNACDHVPDERHHARRRRGRVRRAAAARDEATLARAHPGACRHPFRTSRNIGHAETVLLPLRWTRRSAEGQSRLHRAGSHRGRRPGSLGMVAGAAARSRVWDSRHRLTWRRRPDPGRPMAGNACRDRNRRSPGLAVARGIVRESLRPTSAWGSEQRRGSSHPLRQPSRHSRPECCSTTRSRSSK